MRSTLLVVVVALVSSVACSKKDGAGGADAAASASASAAPKNAAAPAAPPRKPGVMPWADFASGPTTAKKDDYVLVPSGNWIDDAFTKGTDKTTFIYYAAKMVEPGATESKVKGLSGSEFSAPNGFILPLKPEQKVKVGDVILTWWQSGSGMQRSLVTGGTPEEPKVQHLDQDLDNPSKSVNQEDTLKKSSFHKLGNGLEPGVTLAVKEGKTYSRWVATAVSGDKVLAIGFAGKMNVFKKSDCTVVAPAGSFAPGKDVAVPYIGSFQKGKVDRVDAKAGRVFTKFDWGGTEKVVGVGLPNVSPLLPGM